MSGSNRLFRHPSGVFYRHPSGVFGPPPVSGDLYICGRFNRVGATTCLSIARNNGTSWTEPGGGIQNDNPLGGLAYSMAVYQSKLYVGGHFSKAGELEEGDYSLNVVSWNKTAFAKLNEFGVDTNVFCMGNHGGKLMLGGNMTFLGEEVLPDDQCGLGDWDGANFGVPYGGVDNTVLAIASYQNKLHVAGAFEQINGQSITDIARWDGSSFTALPGGLDVGYASILALLVWGDYLYAGGEAGQDGGALSGGVGYLDGSTWHAMPALCGNPDQVFALCVFRGELYAAGNFKTSHGAVTDRIAKYDAEAGEWVDVGGGGVSLTIIYSLVVWRDRLIAVGRDETFGATASPVYSYDGTSWSNIGSVISREDNGLGGFDDHAATVYGAIVY